jgi:hypothetical protein
MQPLSALNNDFTRAARYELKSEQRFLISIFMIYRRIPKV